MRQALVLAVGLALVVGLLLSLCVLGWLAEPHGPVYVRPVPAFTDR